MKKLLLSITSLALLASLTPAHAIKKCQDANGRWHYGDIAVQQCKKSKVTTLNKRGFIKSEREAPKTEEQLLKEREELAAAEAEAARIRAEEDERNRILSVYETEADIDRQRDNQIKSVEGSMAVHKAYVKSLTGKIGRLEKSGANFKGMRKERHLAEIEEAKAKIKNSTLELEKLDKQKESIIARFDKEKRIYKEIKDQN